MYVYAMYMYFTKQLINVICFTLGEIESEYC